MSQEVVPYQEATDALALLFDLRRTGVLTDTGVEIDRDLTYDQVESLIAMFGHIREITTWAIGDLLNYSAKRWGEKYSQMTTLTELAPQTLMNYASVCGNIPKSRRRMRLSFSHHETVQFLPPKEQRQILKRAEEEQWTRSRMRDEVAPLRAALNGGQSADADSGKVEILPPAGETHLCRCGACGRWHRRDEDVERD